MKVTLPHTWNAADATDLAPGYRRSVGWYRRSLDVIGYPADARFILHFEGANTVADVRVNGRRAGGHTGGYIGFDVDVTGYLDRQAPNVILVRVSNADDPTIIPSSRSDFVIYGGLTRNVSLRVVPPAHIGHVSVRTPVVNRAQGRAVATVASLSLWWLGTLLFDLVFVWHHYIRHSKIREHIHHVIGDVPADAPGGDAPAGGPPVPAPTAAPTPT